MERVRLVKCDKQRKRSLLRNAIITERCNHTGHQLRDGNWFHRESIGEPPTAVECPQKDMHGRLALWGGCGICDLTGQRSPFAGAGSVFPISDRCALMPNSGIDVIVSTDVPQGQWWVASKESGSSTFNGIVKVTNGSGT